ncbi:MAG: DUF4347 domain-containing protein [Chlamydiales bacterium]|nr:DUF4347 domain-containing protein [Chlamydiales bacterium]
MGFLSIQLLEDRIVLDGAIAHDVSAEPSPEPVHPTDNHNPNLVVLSDGVADGEVLKKALNKDASVLAYDPHSETLNSLSSKIADALHGQQAESISFISDGAEGQFNLLADHQVDKDSLEKQAMQDFWDDVSSHILPQGSINILGSEVAKGTDGVEFLKKLDSLVNTPQSESEITIYASDNPTGAMGLDGDWVMEYPPTGPPKDATNPLSLVFDTEALSQWNHLLSLDNNNTTENNVLVVRGDLSDASILEDSVKDGITVITYDPAQTTLNSLYQSIVNALDGKQADSIGFVTGGSEGSFSLLNNTTVDSLSLDNLEMQQFWRNVASNITDHGSVNILGCNVAAGDIGLAFMNKFNSLLDSSGSDITVNASVDLTGASDQDGDWTLEFSSASQPVDTQALYFDAGIQDWDHLLAPGITAIPTSGLTVNEFGTTDTFTVVLDEAPTNDVIINLTLNPSDADEITLSDSDEFNQTSITLTFTTGDWSTPQTVTITGQLDTVTDGDQVIPITLDPSSSIDAGYQVLAPFDVTVTNQDVSGSERSFALAYSTNTTGGIAQIANSNSFASDGTPTQAENEDMIYVDIDSDGLNGNDFSSAFTTFNSSLAELTTAQLPVGANVLFARLYWGGSRDTGGGANGAPPVNDAARMTVLFKTPTNSDYVEITADQLDQGNGQNYYDAYADVTSLVDTAGLGDYYVANIQASQGTTLTVPAYSGWSLIIVYEDPAQTTYHNLTVYDGFVRVSGATPQNFAISGFNTPASGAINSSLAIFSYEGDSGDTNPGFAGDTFRIDGTLVGNTLNPTTDFFNSSITRFDTDVTTRDPANTPNLGVDADILDVSSYMTNSQTSTNLSFQTTGENYYPTMLALDVELNQAALDITKTVSNITAPGEDLYAGDTLEYEITITNNGADFGDDVVLSDLIPTNSTYVGGSLEITQNPGGSTGAQTDGIGDDFADFDGSQAIFYLGAGATFSTGGTLSSGDTAIVHFRVTVDSVSGGTVISNTATSTWTNRELANAGSSSSNPADVTVVDPPTITIADNSVLEGNSGTTNLDFTITASAAVNRTISGLVNTADDLATLADNDYVQLTNAPFSFNPSVSDGTVTVVINGDTNVEADETLDVVLSSVSGATFDGGGATLSATGTITNDDFIDVTVSDVSAFEGDNGTTTFVFTITRSASAPFDVNFDYTTTGLTATSGVDFTATSGSSVITSGGAGTTTINVQVTNEYIRENDETFTLDLTNITNANSATAQGTGTIVNDDTTIVTSTANAVTGTPASQPFPKTLLVAAATPGDDIISFNIGTGFQIITLGGVTVNDPDSVTIDGSTQPGYTSPTASSYYSLPTGMPIIRLNASGDFNVVGNANANVIIKGIEINSTSSSEPTLNYNNTPATSSFTFEDSFTNFHVQTINSSNFSAINSGFSSAPDSGRVGFYIAHADNFLLSKSYIYSIVTSFAQGLLIEDYSGALHSTTGLIDHIFYGTINGNTSLFARPMEFILIGGADITVQDSIFLHTYSVDNLFTVNATATDTVLIQNNRFGVALNDTAVGTVNDHSILEINGAGDVDVLNNTFGNSKALSPRNTAITLNGSNALIDGNTIGANAARDTGAGGYYGIVFNGSASNNIAQNNWITNQTFDGILFTSSSTNNTAQGNTFGLNGTETAAIPNVNGIRINSPGNIIQNNIVARSSNIGIIVNHLNSQVLNNIVGLNSTGTAVAPGSGGSAGITIGPQAGSTNPTTGSLIQGNTIGGLTYGMRIFGAGSGTSGTISQNNIGVNITGTSAIANADGIYIEGANALVIDNNVIAGNTVANIYVINSNGLTITNNKIGINATGTAVISSPVAGDAPYGIRLGLLHSTNTITGNTIGGHASTDPENNRPGYGIYVTYLPASGSLTVGSNFIGTDSTGTATLSNDIGFWLEGGLAGNAITVEQNLFKFNNLTAIVANNGLITIQNNTLESNPGVGSAGSYLPYYAIHVPTAPGNTYVLGNTITDFVAGAIFFGGGGNFSNPNQIDSNIIHDGLGHLETIGGTDVRVVMYIPTNNHTFDSNEIYNIDNESATDPLAAIIVGADIQTANNNNIHDITSSGGGETWAMVLRGAGDFSGTIIENTGNGILIESGFSNRIIGGSINSGGIGIDSDISNPTAIAGDGITDNGPSSPINFYYKPIITSVTDVGLTRTIVGYYIGQPASNGHRIQFYSNQVLGSSGYGEGLNYLGQVTVSPSTGTNRADFTFVTTADPVNNLISAMATTTNNLFAATSEFSETASPTPYITVDDNSASSANEEVVEGNPPDTNNLTFTVRLSNPSATDIDFTYSTDDLNTAKSSDSDFSPVTGGTFTIAAGQLTHTFTIDVTADTKLEADEYVNVTINAISGNVPGPEQLVVQGLILNDDTTPVISITDEDGATTATDASVLEGDSGTVLLTFRATLSNQSDQDVTFQIDTADGTALTSDSDYVQIVGQTVTILANTDDVTFSVTINGDTDVEASETLDVILSNVNGAVFDGAGATLTATGTIINDDAPAEIIVDTFAVNENTLYTSELGGIDSFSVVLSRQPTDDVTIDFYIEDPTEAHFADNDTTHFSITFTSLNWNTPQLVRVEGIDDGISDNDIPYRVFSMPAVSNDANFDGIDGVELNYINLNRDGNDSQISGANIILRPFTARYLATGAVDMTFTGNQNTTGTGGSFNTGTNSYVDIDDDAGTFNSSMGELTLPSGVNVLYAGLYWTGQSTLSNESVLLDFGGEVGTQAYNYNSVIAHQVEITSNITVASADITEFVKANGSGRYNVANIQNDLVGTSGAGWAIWVVYEDTANITENRTVAFYDGHIINSVQVTNPGYVISLGGFTTNLTGDVTASVGTVINDPDRGLGDSLTINSSLITSAGPAPSGDFAYSIISSFGSAFTNRNPFLPSTVDGIDIKQFDVSSATTGVLTNGDTSINLEYPSSDGLAYEFVGLSTSSEIAADLNVDKNLVNITQLGKDVFPGDELEYRIYVRNAGSDIADSVVLTDLLQSDTTYVPGSITVNGVAQTDSSGDDLAEISGSTLTFRLGPSATSVDGGSIVVGGIDYITYRVIVNPAVTNGTEISNNATATWINRNLGTADSDTSLDVVNIIRIPELSIDSPSQLEGNSGTAPMDFTITATNTILPHIPTNRLIGIDTNTIAGTATAADNDYVATTGSTFIDFVQDTTATTSVNIVGDTKLESDETFTLRLSNPIDATLQGGGATLDATGTILNDDSTPIISITDEDGATTATDASVLEGDSGTVLLTFRATLSNQSDQDITFEIDTADGTALTSDSDYVSISGQTVTILANTDDVTFSVTVNGDTKLEADETVNVTLSNVSGATFNGGGATLGATGTILNDDAIPIITITDEDGATTATDASVLEGDSGTVLLTFRATLSNQSDQNVTFEIDTADGTALTSDSDYVAIVGQTITILAGTDDVTFTVTVNGDTTLESDETLNVTLSNASGATFDGGGATLGATGTILNDDAVPVITITDEDGATTATDASVLEGDSGTVLLTFRATLSNQSDQDVTFEIDTADGTALTSDSDYVAIVGQTITILAGTDDITFSVTVNGDTTLEADETLDVTLSNATGATFDGGGSTLTATGTILNDDGVPIISISDEDGATTATDASVLEGDSGTVLLTFRATLSNQSDQDVTFQINTANGTALTSDSDYVQIVGQTITILANTDDVTFSVTVNGDTKLEADETVNVTLSNASGATFDGGGATLGATGTILNDDTTPVITITDEDGATTATDASVLEGDSGTVLLTFRATLSNQSDQDVTFEIDTADGTALTSDSDYVAIVGQTVTILAGTDDVTFSVTVNGDTKLEADETLDVTLSNASGATFDGGGATLGATGTILNDDAVPVITITDEDGATTATDASVLEGDSGTVLLTFRATLSNQSDQDVTFEIDTADGTALTSDSDYVSIVGQTVTILANTDDATFTVLVNGDTRVEPDETLDVVLSSASGATFNGGGATLTATGTILNDDAIPTITITDEDGATTATDASVLEGDSGTASLTFRATLSSQSDQDVTFVIDTADGTALVSDSDYVSIVGQTVTILANTDDVTFTVLVNGDTKLEADETLDVVLSSASGATFNGGGATLTATGTILNDDATPTITITDEDGATTATDASVLEGNSGTASLTFRATLSSQSDQDVTFVIDTADGTALVSDSDYVSIVGQTVTILANTDDVTFTVLVNGDTKLEADETLDVVLSSASGATFNGGGATLTATGTILNDDATPTITITDEDGATTATDASVLEGDSGTASLTFRATLSNQSDQDVTFVIDTADGTALVSDSDYVSIVGQTVTILANTDDATFTVLVNGDTTFEADETLDVVLSSASGATFNGGGATLTAIGTILNDDAIPTITITDEDGATTATDASVLEGDSGTASLTFRATLSNQSDQDVTFVIDTADGTALVSDSDYVSIVGQTVTILANTDDVTFTVLVNGDTKLESDETLDVVLSSASGATFDGGGATLTATGTILNDDATPTITITDEDGATTATDASVLEGNSGTASLTFRATLSNQSDQDVTFVIDTADGTALVSDSDYVSIVGQTVTILANTDDVTFTVLVNGDTKYENDETVNVTLSNANGATFDGGGATLTATGTILNDDIKPNISIDDDNGTNFGNANVIEGNPGDDQRLTFNVTLDAVSGVDTVVNFSFTDNSTDGADFDHTSGSFTILAGNTTGTFQVNVTEDLTPESDESFTVVLTSAETTNGTTTGSGVIINDDANIAIIDNNGANAGDAETLEGNTGDTNLLTFTISLDRELPTDVTFLYSTMDGTATVGDNDYLLIPTSVPVTITAGSLNTTVSIQVVGDEKYEPNETVQLTVDVLSGNTLNNSTFGTGVIINDDGRPTVTINDVNVVSGTTSEGNNGIHYMTFTVALSNPSAETIVVGWETSDGSAQSSDQDYVYGSGAATFIENDITQTIQIAIIGDTRVEPDETFQVNLTNGTNISAFAKSSGLGTIINDDEDPATPPTNPPPPNGGVPPVIVPPIELPNLVPIEIGDSSLSLPHLNPEDFYERVPEIVVTDLIYRENTDRVLQGEFSIYLTAKPNAPVTIPLRSLNLPDTALSTRSLTFTPENWDTPQTVNVTDENADQPNNPDGQQIITEPATSSDDDYNNLDPRDLDIWRQKTEGGNAANENEASEHQNAEE